MDGVNETQNYEMETKWIRDEAKLIAEKLGKHYSVIEFIGLNAYNLGDSADLIREQMRAGGVNSGFVHGHGTG